MFKPLAFLFILFLGLERLIKDLKAQGIEKIRGDFCLDLTLFDEVIQGPGWMWRGLKFPTSAT